MASRLSGNLSAASATNLVASWVGTWERDAKRGLIRCDPVMGAIFGLTDREIETGVRLDRFQSIIHPEDRHIFARSLADVRAGGRISLLEYRIVPAPGLVRWVLIRGYYDRPATGQIAPGRGIAIDITDAKQGGDAAGCGFDLSRGKAEAEGTALDQVAAVALDLRRAIDMLDADKTQALRPAIDILLWQIGRALAGEMVDVCTHAAPRMRQ